MEAEDIKLVVFADMSETNSAPKRIVVAIDGPAGAGKSTVTKQLAGELGYDLLDTGALYRAVAWLCAEEDIAFQDAAQVAEVARGMAIRFRTEGSLNRVFVGDREVTAEIRTPEISEGASLVSAFPAVREALLGQQRRIGAAGGVVAEGRDVGTVVFPEAEAKFFLTASVEVRARRRYDELREKGEQVDLEATLEEIRKRDERDSSREVAPLRQAPDAVVVDSSNLSPDEVVRAMLEVVRQREAGPRS